MWLLSLLLLVDPVSGENLHKSQNPVYRDQLETGIALTPKHHFKLQSPYFPDGLAAGEQKKLIEKLGGRRYSWELLTRESMVAPQIIQIQEENLPGTDTKARVVHVYFVAYGNLEAIAKGGKLNQPGDGDDKQWDLLSPEDLAEKKIVVEDPTYESYGFLTNDLIEKVRLSGVLRTYWSQSENSLIAAAMLDPRFDDDPDYPSRWQPLNRGRAGKASPYSGAGGYTKITRLDAIKGALFVESHLVFAEPHDWFNGANLLASKLPAVFQYEVRSARAEFQR